MFFASREAASLSPNSKKNSFVFHRSNHSRRGSTILRRVFDIRLAEFKRSSETRIDYQYWRITSVDYIKRPTLTTVA